MRAVVFERYGPPDVLRLEEIEPPVPKDDEVRIKVHATTVSRTDCALRGGEPFISRFVTGVLRPKRKVLGSDLAGEVEAVGVTELVRSLGADEVIDYAEEDFTENGQTYDAILDAVGNLSFRRCRGSLKRGGVYLATDGWQNLFLSVWTRTGDKRARFSIPPRFTKDDVLFLKQLMEVGRYRAVIDRRYPLEQVVEATRYVETKQKTGNVVLTISRDAGPSAGPSGSARSSTTSP
jgi:NADPH:quinone reductase-like Zn-dependent oxidoreductase